MKAVVHIGTEKTGTTSIQHYLFARRPELAAQGFHIADCLGEDNHIKLALLAYEDARCDDQTAYFGLSSEEGEPQAFTPSLWFFELMFSLP